MLINKHGKSYDKAPKPWKMGMMASHGENLTVLQLTEPGMNEYQQKEM